MASILRTAVGMALLAVYGSGCGREDGDDYRAQYLLPVEGVTYVYFDWPALVSDQSQTNAFMHPSEDYMVFSDGLQDINVFYAAQMNGMLGSAGAQLVNNRRIPDLEHVVEGATTVLRVSPFLRPGDGIADVCPYVYPVFGAVQVVILADDDFRQLVPELHVVWGTDLRDEAGLREEVLTWKDVSRGLSSGWVSQLVTKDIWKQNPTTGGVLIGNMSRDDVKEGRSEGKVVIRMF